MAEQTQAHVKKFTQKFDPKAWEMQPPAPQLCFFHLWGGAGNACGLQQGRVAAKSPKYLGN